MGGRLLFYEHGLPAEIGPSANVGPVFNRSAAKSVGQPRHRTVGQRRRRSEGRRR